MSRNAFDFRLRPVKVKPFGSYRVKKPKRSLGKNDRDILFMRAKGKCEACGKKLMQPEMQVGHKKAYSKGGATTMANSVCLCYVCNKNQGTGSFETLKKKYAGTYGKETKTTKTKKKSIRQKPVSPFGIQPTKVPLFRF